MEIIGGEYFDDLASRSFFHDLDTNEDGKVFCRMHDLLHDFANFISNNECSIVKGDDKECGSARTRHLFIRLCDNEPNPILPSILKAKLLRSLHIGVGTPRALLNLSFMNRLTCLRTLDLSYVVIETLPDEVGSLIHLRYLDLSESELVELPATVSNLKNLQTLKLNSCKDLRRLPDGLVQMVSLRHLEIDYTYSLECLPQGLGELKHLQTLSKFVVSDEGCQPQELADLNNLKGKLVIANINLGLKDASKAKLNSKQHLRLLRLYFVKESYERKSIHDANALESLEPYPNLEELGIINYGGRKFPAWMNLQMEISNLTIIDCSNLEVLPPFGKLKSLQCLNLSGLYSVSPECIFNGFDESTTVAYPNLKEFTIGDMKHWEEWATESVGDIILMPVLRTLKICECPNLKSLAHQILSDSLIKVEIKSCPELRISYLPPLLEMLYLWDDAGSLLKSLPFENNTSLTHLGISHSLHSTLPSGLTQLKALHTLIIDGCNSLKCIVEDLQHTTSLAHLSIWRCPILVVDWKIISHIPEIWIDGERIKSGHILFR